MRNLVSLITLALLWLPPATTACPWARLSIRPKVAEKAEQLAKEPSLRIVLSEIGAAQRIADTLLDANPEMNLISLSPYDRAASDARYGRAGTDFDPKHYINEFRLTQQLDTEWRSLKAAPGEIPLVLADTVATSRGNGHAWIGARTLYRGEPIEVRLHVRLSEGRSSLQKETLGKLGVNLAYAMKHYCDAPHTFLASLLDGIEASAATIDCAHGTGPFLMLKDGWPLLEAGITPFLLLAPNGEVTESPVPEQPRPPRPAAPAENEEPGPDITFWKAKRLSLTDDLKGTLIEIGGGAKIASRYFEAPYGQTLYQTVYYGNAEAAVGRYGEDARSANRFARLETILETELAHVTYHKAHRKFVVASLVEGNRVYLGVLGQQIYGGPAARLMFEADLKATDPREIREMVGVLGINALYGFFHCATTRENFLKRLPEGLAPGKVEVLEFRAAAPDERGSPFR